MLFPRRHPILIGTMKPISTAILFLSLPSYNLAYTTPIKQKFLKPSFPYRLQFFHTDTAMNPSALSATRTSTDHNYKYWNRELRSKRNVSNEQNTTQYAKILSLSDPNDDSNTALYSGELPEGATLLAVGTSFDEFDIEALKKQNPNVIFVSHPQVSVSPICSIL